MLKSRPASPETTHGMSEGQLQAWAEREYAKLEGAYGSELENKLQSAAKMIDALDRDRPGLKALLKNRALGMPLQWSRSSCNKLSAIT
jgi:hypothetical protein